MPDSLAPELRNTVLKEMMQSLYLNTKRHNFKVLADIVRANSKILRNSQPCFSFRGEVYSIGDNSNGYPRPMNLLQSACRADMKQYLLMVDEQEREKEFLRGYILKVFHISDQAADYYKLLPAPLHSIVRKYAMHFAPGEGKISEKASQAFLDENAKYGDMIKARLTFNLIGL